MNENNVAIRIWTRFTLPPEYDYVRKHIEKDGDDPCVTWIAHIPKAMLKDQIFSEYVREPHEFHAWSWLDGDWNSDISLFGTNAGDYLEHPEGDGYFLIGSSI